MFVIDEVAQDIPVEDVAVGDGFVTGGVLYWKYSSTNTITLSEGVNQGVVNNVSDFAGTLVSVRGLVVHASI